MKALRVVMVASVAALSALSTMATPAFAADRNQVSSGKTQVVARVGAREITLSELRLEMAELGLAADNPASERVALESLTNRIALADAARAADFHRKPQTMARMYAAQDRALADLYLATASRPPEPTRDEIDAYIADNPTLFGKRGIYDFTVIALATENFDEEVLTPFFDKEPDFNRLTRLLDKAGAPYEIAVSTRTSDKFPKVIRQQLARYDVNDNIVLKGADRTQILKIIGKRPAPLNENLFGVFARQSLLREQSEKRARSFLDSLKSDAGVAYFRDSAAPLTGEEG